VAWSTRPWPAPTRRRTGSPPCRSRRRRRPARRAGDNRPQRRDPCRPVRPQDPHVQPVDVPVGNRGSDRLGSRGRPRIAVRPAPLKRDLLTRPGGHRPAVAAMLAIGRHHHCHPQRDAVLLTGSCLSRMFHLLSIGEREDLRLSARINERRSIVGRDAVRHDMNGGFFGRGASPIDASVGGPIIRARVLLVEGAQDEASGSPVSDLVID
jgi:hypothetical protein